MERERRVIFPHCSRLFHQTPVAYHRVKGAKKRGAHYHTQMYDGDENTASTKNAKIWSGGSCDGRIVVFRSNNDRASREQHRDGFTRWSAERCFSTTAENASKTIDGNSATPWKITRSINKINSNNNNNKHNDVDNDNDARTFSALAASSKWTHEGTTIHTESYGYPLATSTTATRSGCMSTCCAILCRRRRKLCLFLWPAYGRNHYHGLHLSGLLRMRREPWWWFLVRYHFD